MQQYCGGDEEFSHQISLVHNFANIVPLSTIVAYPCSLLRSLSATKRLEGWELWGQRYCYWWRRPWCDDVLCEGWVVVCGGAYTLFCKCLGRGFFENSIQQNTSFAHTQNSIQKAILREEHTTLWDQSTPPKTRSMWDVTVGVCATWYILNGEESVEIIPSRWNSKIFMEVYANYSIHYAILQSVVFLP